MARAWLYLGSVHLLTRLLVDVTQTPKSYSSVWRVRTCLLIDTSGLAKGVQRQLHLSLRLVYLGELPLLRKRLNTASQVYQSNVSQSRGH